MVNLPPFSPSDFTEDLGGGAWTIGPAFLKGLGGGGLYQQLTIAALPLQGAVIVATFDFFCVGDSRVFAGNPWPFCGIIFGPDVPGTVVNLGTPGVATATLIDDVLYTSICNGGATLYRPAITKSLLYAGNTVTIVVANVVAGARDVSVRYQNPTAGFDETRNFPTVFGGADLTGKLFIQTPADPADSYLKVNSLFITSAADTSGDILLSSRGNGVASGAFALNPSGQSDSGSSGPAKFRLFPFDI